MSSRGFASMDPEKQHEIASKGGQARGRQLHEQAEQRKQMEGRNEAAGEVQSKSGGGQGFASMDPEKQHEIASKGGKSRGKQHHEESDSRKELSIGNEGEKSSTITSGSGRTTRSGREFSSM